MSYNPLDDYDKIKSRLEQLMEKTKNPEERSLLERIASGVHRLKESALVNPVTGYHGIRERDVDVQQLKQRDYTSNFGVFLVVLDVDNFGKFNKKYGQQTGNKVLRAITKILEESIREYDIMGKGYHLHGEELEVILQAPSKEIACLIADRLRKKIETKSKKLTKGHPVTATFGVTEWDISKEEFKAAELRADRAMQQGKKEKKNQVYYT